MAIARRPGHRCSRTCRNVFARRLLGVCFLLLAAYVGIESLRALWIKAQPARSLPGILIAVAAVIVMPLLGRAKRRVAAQLGSRALHADSRQADFCAYLSAILLVGLLLHALLGWWWADPAAALVMVPIIARRGAVVCAERFATTANARKCAAGTIVRR